MRIEAVIFDCDGTLVDSEPIGFEAIIAEARALGVDITLDDEMLAQKGRSMRSTLKTVARRHGQALPADFEPMVRERMAGLFRERLQPMPGALRMLERLHVPFCVASNGPRAKMELTLGITGMLGHFEGRIFSAYEVGSFKPDPGLFLHAARALGVRPQQCAVVEDSAAGVRAGIAAGMSVFLLRSPEPLPAELTGLVRGLDQLSQLHEALLAGE